MLSSNEQLRQLQELYDLVDSMTAGDVHWLLEPYLDALDLTPILPIQAKIEVWAKTPEHVTSIIRIVKEHLNDAKRIF
jgi:hypothetical protein